MKNLLVVESPAKMKTISKYVGNNFIVVSTVGHIKDLPDKGMGIVLQSPQEGQQGKLELEYVVLEGKEKVVQDLKKQALKAGGDIYLAPDPDREGEIIAYHVAQELADVVKDPAKFHRITFHEITQQAIMDALKHPHAIDTHKVQAQQARRVLDRIVGYEVSPLLWRKIAPGLSAGRVQSVALKLICLREEEIREFKPREYWTIHGVFIHADERCHAQLTHYKSKKVEPASQEEAQKIIDAARTGLYTITADKHTTRSRAPAAPFITSTLQQAAYNSLGFSVQKTMQIAQRLYEGVSLGDPQSPVALITYMRTDSPRIADTALKQVRGYIKEQFGAEYVPGKSLVYAKGGQDAHEAIRPISVTVSPDHVKSHLDKDDWALYTLIWKRFVACQMEAARYAQRALTIASSTDGITFKATGSTLLFDGFMKVYQEADDTEDAGEKSTAIPASFVQGLAITAGDIKGKQHFTQPPARYSQATLVKEMTKEGIGRPSTYVAIMNTIQARAYTTLDDKKRFVPTELGMAVTKLLSQGLPHIMNIGFTALMEENLDKVAQGVVNRDELVFDFYKMFKPELAQLAGNMPLPEETNITCPQCHQHKLAIRVGKTGAFIGCMGYPECTFTSNFTRHDDGSVTLVKNPEPELLDQTCPQCGKPLRKMVGRYGPFIACSGYPECKYIYTPQASFPCPSCGGTIIKRTWKGKTFWGCKNYPKCTFSISGDIEDSLCPTCKQSPYLLKKIAKDGTITLQCPRKECGVVQKLHEN